MVPCTVPSLAASPLPMVPRTSTCPGTCPGTSLANGKRFMTFRLHRGDLPDGLTFKGAVAIDTETLGLNPHRDRLCLVQISSGDGTADLVQILPGQTRAPNLEALFKDRSVLKLFHF